MAESLLSRIAKGDPAAMNECLNQYGGLVWSIVRKKCADRTDAEDIVQDIFVDLWKSAGRFDSQRASETTFIAMLSRRRCIDFIRRSKTRPAAASLQDTTEPVGSTEGQLIEVQEEVLRVRSFMKELRTEERSVIELAVDEGLSQSQIAERTKIPLGTVKTHARRGMARLRQMLIGNAAIEGEAI